jgi:hypothetical protein
MQLATNDRRSGSYTASQLGESDVIVAFPPPSPLPEAGPVK